MNDWKIFFWAVTHSDISEVRIVFTSPILTVFEECACGFMVGLIFRTPSLYVYLPSSIYQQFRYYERENNPKLAVLKPMM